MWWGATLERGEAWEGEGRGGRASKEVRSMLIYFGAHFSYFEFDPPNQQTNGRTDRETNKMPSVHIALRSVE